MNLSSTVDRLCRESWFAPVTAPTKHLQVSDLLLEIGLANNARVIRRAYRKELGLRFGSAVIFDATVFAALGLKARGLAVAAWGDHYVAFTTGAVQSINRNERFPQK